MPARPSAFDLAVLAWVGRFRFVTATLVGERFGVSVQRARARLRRLEREGLVGRERATQAEEHAVFLTPLGFAWAGLLRRRPPRVHVQREHELAIAWLSVRLERGGGGPVLTERQCRRIEATSDARRSADVLRCAGRGDRRRWPDLVVETADGLIAYEIEFAPKGSERLEGIVDAYLHSPVFTGAVFFVGDPGLAGRLTRIVVEQVRHESTAIFRNPSPTRVLVQPWPAAAAPTREAVSRSIERVRRAAE